MPAQQEPSAEERDRAPASATRGIVSTFAPFAQFPSLSTGNGWVLQTDAVMNPGNSGVRSSTTVAASSASPLPAVHRRRVRTDGRSVDVDGIGYGVAAETIVARLADLRSSPHAVAATPSANALTIRAFCTHQSTENLGVQECHERSASLDPEYDRWHLWAEGVADFANVVYRIDAGATFSQANMSSALLALGGACHDLQIAETGISNQWSLPYEFCVTSSASDAPVPATPTGLRLSKVDIALAPDHITITWDAVWGAARYEVYHQAAGTKFTREATVTNTSYLDRSPNVLYLDSCVVRACNASGCSLFSTRVTEH